MNAITCLKSYRRLKRAEYLSRHSKHIDAFISFFFRSNLQFDFAELARAYVHSQAGANESSWDYLDFRDELREALAKKVVESIYAQLIDQAWFDRRYIDHEQITDRCVSLFILEDWAAIS